MSVDLLEQLAQYGADHRTRQAPVDTMEIQARVTDLTEPVAEPAGAKPPARPRIVLVAAAAVIVVLVAGLAFVAGRDELEPSDIPGTDLIQSTEPSLPETTIEPLPTPSTTTSSQTTTPPTTAAPSTTEVGAAGPTVAPEVAAAESQWARVDGVEMFAVVSDGKSFIAVADLGEGRQLVRSDDGVVWEAYAEPPDVVLEQFEEFFDGSQGPSDPGRSSVAVRDGRLVTVLDGRNSLTVQLVERDGTLRTVEVPVEIPPEWEPFHTELNPQVHLLEDGRIVITAGYRADEALVAASGQTRDDLGLPPLYSLPRPIVISSDDGVTWTQVDTLRMEGVTPAPGGLVALVGPIVSALVDLRLSSSADGAVWQPVEALEVVSDLDTWILPFSSGNRTFVSVEAPLGTTDTDQDGIWEITTDGPRRIAGGDAASEPLELLYAPFWELTAGEAGLAYVLTVDPDLVERGRQDPLPNGPGIRYSVDDGQTWEFEAFPVVLEAASTAGLAIGATHIVLVNSRDGQRELWVREFPD